MQSEFIKHKSLTSSVSVLHSWIKYIIKGNITSLILCHLVINQTQGLNKTVIDGRGTL